MTIYDPKERVICAASFPERVLHHAIMNICHPIFEKYQIFDSYATRVGKGQYAALDRARFLNKKYRWFCKLDVRKYFDSINHDVLLQKLEHKFKDKRLLKLFKAIIESYEVKPGRGVPIGNLTSQYFANYYLGFADHFVKEKLQVKAYVRYMDDMVLCDNDKLQLKQIVEQFTGFIQKDLELNVKPLCLHRTEKGLPYLGYVLFQENIRLNKHSKQRFLDKIEQYGEKLNQNQWSQKEYANHVLPLFAFTSYADTRSLRKKIVDQGNIPVGLQPCESRRQLEQQCR